MVVVKFSCNFDVVVGGGEYSIYLFHHLDQKSDQFLPFKSRLQVNITHLWPLLTGLISAVLGAGMSLTEWQSLASAHPTEGLLQLLLITEGPGARVALFLKELKAT